ncbi:hypothetical protein ACFW04_013636 [Cataglyphis niger]
MTEAEEILREIEELLGEISPEPKIPPAGKGMARTTYSKADDQAVATARTTRPPRVGTLVQRSDRTNARKLQGLLQQPPPLPARPRRPTAPDNTRPSTATAEQQPQLLMPTGPLPPPPIQVQVEPGIVFEVPHFAVHVALKYKNRSPQGHWVMRFSKTGQLRYRRRIS